MKYEKHFKALQAIYLLTSSYTVHKEMYWSLLKFFSKMRRLFE